MEALRWLSNNRVDTISFPDIDPVQTLRQHGRFGPLLDTVRGVSVDERRHLNDLLLAMADPQSPDNTAQLTNVRLQVEESDESSLIMSYNVFDVTVTRVAENVNDVPRMSNRAQRTMFFEITLKPLL